MDRGVARSLLETDRATLEELKRLAEHRHSTVETAPRAVRLLRQDEIRRELDNP